MGKHSFWLHGIKVNEHVIHWVIEVPHVHSLVFGERKGTVTTHWQLQAGGGWQLTLVRHGCGQLTLVWHGQLTLACHGCGHLTLVWHQHLALVWHGSGQLTLV